MSVAAVIFAGGRSPTLSVLTATRTEAALPFGARYRVIDFALSNCANSGIHDVAVLTQYEPRSLNEHLGIGEPWHLDRALPGLRLVQPYQGSKGERITWPSGTADALRCNLDVLANSTENVLILAGDHIYKMDYRPMIRFHQEHQAELTIAVHRVRHSEAHRFGIIINGADGEVMVYEEKPRRPRGMLASMGVYIFRRDCLVEWLTSEPGKRQRDLGGEVIPALVGSKRIYAYPFDGYWSDVGMVHAFWEANMALLAEPPSLDLSDTEWMIYTRNNERPAALIGTQAQIERALLGAGSRIGGTVIRSIISPGVSVAPGAMVRDSIVLNDAVIAPGAEVGFAIVDEQVRIGERAKVGWYDDHTPHRRWPSLLNPGLTLVGMRAFVPPGARICPNVVICPNVSSRAFSSALVPSGETIEEE